MATGLCSRIQKPFAPSASLSPAPRPVAASNDSPAGSAPTVSVHALVAESVNENGAPHVPDALDEAVRSYALTVAKSAPSAIALTKSLLAAQHGMSLEAGLEYAAGMNALARGTEPGKQRYRLTWQPDRSHERQRNYAPARR